MGAPLHLNQNFGERKLFFSKFSKRDWAGEVGALSF
jgi:hypothetical protein